MVNKVQKIDVTIYSIALRKHGRMFKYVIVRSYQCCLMKRPRGDPRRSREQKHIIACHDRLTQRVYDVCTLTRNCGVAILAPYATSKVAPLYNNTAALN